MSLTDLVAPVAARWLRRAQAGLDGVPVAADLPRRVVAGPDADRLQILGNGVAVGFGVLSHTLALTGQLSRRLAVATGRGAIVDCTALRGITAGRALELIETVDVTDVDALVLCLGATDAAGLLPVDRWRTGLAAVLDRLPALMAPGSVVLLPAIAPLQRTESTDGPVGRLMARHAARLDRETATLCAEREDAVFVPAPPDEDDAPRTAAQYGALADRLVDALAPRLDRLADRTAPGVARARRRGPNTEVLRRAALERTGLLGTPSTPALERLLQAALDLLGADAAALTLIDGDELEFKAVLGLPRGALPRSIAPGNRTIRQDGPWIVTDLSGQAIAEHGWRFYAGYPVESPDGFRIGTFSVLGARPRRAEDFDGVALMDLASRAEAELWSEIASRRRAPDPVLAATR